MRRTALTLGLIASLVGTPRDAAALQQGSAPLEQVDRLIEDGRVGPARELLLEWWDEGWDRAPRQDRERALWLRGRLTLEPSEAVGSYRRIIAEYPTGRFADQALLRMGYLSVMQGDTLSASRWFTILQRDHPSSPSRLEARAWLASPEVEAAVARGVIVQSQDPDPPPASPPPVVSPRQTVQLGAFSTEGRAYTLAAQAEQAGFPVRVVQVEGSDLWRVRSGKFENDGEAAALYDRLVTAGFEAAVVSDADREESGG